MDGHISSSNSSGRVLDLDQLLFSASFFDDDDNVIVVDDDDDDDYDDDDDEDDDSSDDDDVYEYDNPAWPLETQAHPQSKTGD